MPRARRASPAATIRPATESDVRALGRLGAKLARAHHAWDPARFFLPEEPVEDGYAWWLGKELRNRRAVILAAELGGKVVGYAYGRLEGRDWNMLRDACGEAVDLWVEPEARGAGLGARLVDALVAALEARGAPRVVLGVASRNPVARRLFRRLGFRPTMLEMTRERRAPAAPPNEARPPGPPPEAYPGRVRAQHLYRKQHVVTSVVAVIVDDAERVLLTRRAVKPFRGLWVMPGGTIDVGEPILSALHREVREEIGIDVVVGGLVDVFEHLTPGPENDHFVILYYRCRPASRADVVPNPDEVAEARWVPRGELGGYEVPEGTRFILGALFPELRDPAVTNLKA